MYTLYSTSELKRTHECMGHASARNVQRFLMIGNPGEEFLDEYQERAKEVVSKCLVCERFAISPRRLRIAAAHKYIFNRVVGFDVLHLVGREPTLVMICCGTRMVVTCELPKKTSAEIWKNFLLDWILRLLRPPIFVSVDAAAEFVGPEMEESCRKMGIEMVPHSADAHWSFGVIERVNQSLRHTFEKLWVDPALDDWGKTSLVAIVTHFVNVKITDTNTSAFLLVFGQVPRFLMGHQGNSSAAQKLSNDQRIGVVNAAQLAAEKAHSRTRYLEFKRRNMPSDCDSMEPGRMCMLFREGHQLNLRSKSASAG